MKKKQLLVALIVAFGLYSCSSDDENSSQNQNEDSSQNDTNNNDDSPENEEITLIGKWELVSIVNEGIFEQATDCEAKSIVEFKSDNTFKDIFVTKSEDSDDCVYGGFGVSGTFVLNGDILTRTNVEVIAIPEDINKPSFIEDAKGEAEPETISFEGENMSITENYEEQGNSFSIIYTFKKTTKDFFSE